MKTPSQIKKERKEKLRKEAAKKNGEEYKEEETEEAVKDDGELMANTKKLPWLWIILGAVGVLVVIGTLITCCQNKN